MMRPFPCQDVSLPLLLLTFSKDCFCELITYLCQLELLQLPQLRKYSLKVCSKRLDQSLVPPFSSDWPQFVLPVAAHTRSLAALPAKQTSAALMAATWPTYLYREAVAEYTRGVVLLNQADERSAARCWHQPGASACSCAGWWQCQHGISRGHNLKC